MSKTVKGANNEYVSGSAYNQLEFMMQQTLKGSINTAIPVRVDSVEGGGLAPAGYVSATPLITMYDGFGEIIPATSISKLPYMRYQGGKMAIICDPKPGDVGIAVFAQQDISGMGKEPTKPNSKRSFSMADGMYIGGITNDTPEIYIEFLEDGTIKIVAPQKLIIDTPLVEVTGSITVGAGAAPANMQRSQTKSAASSVTINGTMATSGDVVAGGVSLMTHKHSEVVKGGDESGEPVK